MEPGREVEKVRRVMSNADETADAAAVKGRPDKALAYLFSLPLNRITLTAIIPDGPTTTATFAKSTDSRMKAIKWINDQQAAGKNIYFQDCSIDGPLHQRPKKADVSLIHCAHADLDVQGKLSPTEHAKALAAILGKIAGFTPAPTDVICTGNGAQAYWYLDEALPGSSENIAKIEAASKGLAAALGGDKCHDVAHLLRLPFTVNFPNKKKRDLGRVPVPGYVVTDGHAYDIMWYRLDQLPTAQAPAETKTDKPKRNLDPRSYEGIGSPEIPEMVDLSRLDEDTRKLIKDGVPGGADRNIRVYAVACTMRRARYSDGEILATITDIDNLISAHILDQKQRTAIEQASRIIGEMNEKGISIREFADDPISEEDVEAIPAEPKSRLEVIDLENVKAQNIDYVWPNRLALGKHSAIAGVGGKGKSQVLYHTAARISNGDDWPNNEGKAPKGSFLILSAEDDIVDMMKPRLVAAGANVKLVKPVKAVIEGSGNKKKFNLLADLDALYRLCRERGDVVGVGIDPLGSYLGGTLDTHRDAALRDALDPISEMASAARVAFLSIMHFNKAGSMKSAMDRVMGGAGFVNAPRCAMGWMVDPEDEAKRLLLRLKTNMGEPVGLRAHIATADAGKDERTGLVIRAPLVVWDGSTEITADAVVAMTNEREAPKLDEAIAFLQGQLKDGPRPVADIKKGASAMGITADTLKRARYQLGIEARQVEGVKHGGWEYRYADPADDFEP